MSVVETGSTVLLCCRSVTASELWLAAGLVWLSVVSLSFVEARRQDRPRVLVWRESSMCSVKSPFWEGQEKTGMLHCRLDWFWSCSVSACVVLRFLAALAVTGWSPLMADRPPAASLRFAANCGAPTCRCQSQSRFASHSRPLQGLISAHLYSGHRSWPALIMHCWENTGQCCCCPHRCLSRRFSCLRPSTAIVWCFQMNISCCIYLTAV